jgi:glycosyltransferase involved in cell wall biosynthesis
MKRILFLLLKTQQGGAETQMLNILKNINKKEFSVSLGILYERQQLHDEFYNIKGVKVVDFKKKNKQDVSIYFKIAKFIKKNNIDIVQIFIANHHAFIPAFFVNKCIAIGGIRGCPGQRLSFIDKMKTFTVPKFLAKLNKLILISNSHAAREIYIKKGFDPDKIYVIPNGIDYSLFSKGSRIKIVNEFKLKNKLVFCMISRLVTGKNHDELIRYFKKIREKYKNAVLLLVGDGPEMDNLKSLAKECDESQNIIFTRSRKDIPDILAATDLFVFPSSSEGWPNVVGEAMAAGVPVISYPAGDIKRIIRSGYNGVITEPNMTSLIEEAVSLAKNKNKMKLISANAKKTIKEKFSINALVNNYERLYFNLLKSPTKARTK